MSAPAEDTRSAGELKLARRCGDDSITDERIRAALDREHDEVAAAVQARRDRRSGAPVGDHTIDQTRRERAARRN